MTFFEMKVTLAFLCFYSISSNAQSPITTITYTNSTASSGSTYTTTANISGTTSRTYTYGNQSADPAHSKMIQSFGAAGNKYSLNSIYDGTIAIRRNGTNGTNGGVDLISITGLFTTSTAVVSSPSILPVNYSFWRASLQRNHVELKWNISNPEECSGIELLESGDGRAWTKLAQVPCDQNSYLDSTFGEKNYYRLKFTDIGGQVNYTSVTMVPYRIKNETNKIDVFVKNKRVYVSLESNERTDAVLILFDKAGRLLHRQRVFLIKGKNQTIINVILPQGVYIAQMLSDSQTWSRQFLYNP